MVNNIDICCIQETELEQNYPTEILSTKDFKFESKINNTKKRVGGGTRWSQSQSPLRVQEVRGSNPAAAYLFLLSRFFGPN